jgi:hypothetical protein
MALTWPGFFARVQYGCTMPLAKRVDYRVSMVAKRPMQGPKGREMPRTRLHVLSFVAVLVLLSLVLGAQGVLAVTFTHGVASGDVTPF